MTALARLARSWGDRVAVLGHSMAPLLREGDWLLVDGGAYERRSPSAGELVVAETGDRLVVKRVRAVLPDGSLSLDGASPSRAGHTHEVTVAHGAVSGRPWFRYWPPGRIGRLR